jgi:hypothetical protein
MLRQAASTARTAVRDVACAGFGERMALMRTLVRLYNVGETQAVARGQEELMREAIMIIFEGRFGTMGDELRIALAVVRGEGVLLGLAAIAATCSHEEAIAAMRQAGGII